MTATFWAHDKIQTLRVSARDGDTPALRLALMQTLASVNLHPAGMSPSSVFMIHYLEDPLPGKLINKKQSTSTWRSALRDNLDVLYRQAATPTNCVLSGDPVAVLFRDQAELLACLVVDICAQRVGQHWWWRKRHFSSGHSSQRIRETLIYDARYVPAIFAQLASAGRATEVVKQLEPSHAGDILQALLNEFSLDNIRQLIDEIERASCAADARADIAPEQKNLAHCNGPQTPRSVPPWAALFTGDSWQDDLQREQAALLGIARTLHERPAVMRNRIFQHSLAHWWVNESRPTINTPDDSSIRSIGKNHAGSLKKNSSGKIIVIEPTTHQRNESEKPTHPQFIQNNNTSTLNSPAINEMVTNTTGHFWDTDKKHDQKHVKNIAVFSRVTDLSPQGEKVTRQNTNNYTKNNSQADSQANVGNLNVKNTGFIATEDRLENPNSPATPGLMDAASLQNHLAPESSGIQNKNTLPEEYLENNTEVNLHFSDTYIDTQLGGIIYLINLVQQLGLPKCFAGQWKLEQQLGPWALLDILARALLGKEFACLYADPLWRVLAKLDGRRTKLQIAPTFSGHTDYRIPQSWYEWLQGNQIYWARSRNNIRIWASACILVEKTYTGDALAACIAEMQAYNPDFNPACLQQTAYRNAPLARRSHLQTNGINTELARMLALMMPFVFTFLRRQLHIPAASKRALIREILFLDARIYLSSSHIDLVTGIDNTRFALRCAGLDQDPGWLPDYGRVVLIHFS